MCDIDLLRADQLGTPGMGSSDSRADVEHLIGLVVKRSRLVDLLREGPKYKRDLQEELGVSRSTIYKAVRELEEDGIVERTDGKHRLSLVGRLVHREYREFFDSVAAVSGRGDLLSVLPSEVPFALDALDGAEVTRAERHAPNRPVETVEGIVEGASKLRGMSSAALPQYVAVFRDRIVEGELTADLLLERAVVEYVFENYRDEVAEAFDSDNVRFHETTASLPFGLIVVDEPEPETAVLVYGDDGALKGVIRNDSAAAYDWATEVYASYAGDATEVVPEGAAEDGAEVDDEAGVEKGAEDGAGTEDGAEDG